MTALRYPQSLHIRTQHPKQYKRYKSYKRYLRVEFAKKCVYCRMPDPIRGYASFGVDHYRPTVRFAALELSYPNLFYACNRCNSRKKDFWPTEEELEAGRYLPNPCDHIMFEHLKYSGADVIARTNAGQCAIDVLALNADAEVEDRQHIIRLTNSTAANVKELTQQLKALSRLPSQALDPAAVSMIADITAELRNQTRTLAWLTGE